MDSLDTYLIDSDNNIVQEWSTGDRKPYGTRPIAVHEFLFPLELAPNESYTLLSRVSTEGTFLAKYDISSPFSYVEKKQGSYLIYGGYYGVVAAMSIYSFFLFYSMKEKSYFSCALFILTIGYVQLTRDGFAFQYMYPNFDILNDYATVTFGPLAGYFLLKFSHDLLSIAKRAKRAEWFFKIAEWYLLALLLSSFVLPYKLSAVLANVSLLSTVVITLGISIKISFSGYKPANYFNAAFIFLVGGVVISLLREGGVLPVNAVTNMSLHFGSAGQMVLLSLGLGSKINHERAKSAETIKELNNHLIKANDSLKDLNQGLEEKVEEKTRDTKAILYNLTQGIFSLKDRGDDIVISGDYSPYLETIVDRKELSDQDAFLNIFDRTDLSREKRDSLRAILDTSIGEDEIQWDAVNYSLPTEVRIDQKICEISWDKIIKGDLIEKILVTMRDVTSLREAEEKTKRTEEEAKNLLKICKIKQTDFIEFIQQAEMYIDESNKSLSEQSHFSLQVFEGVFRNLHTLKGLSRHFGFELLSSKIHEVEKELTESISLRSFTQEKRQRTIAGISEVASDFNKIRSLAEEKLQIDFDSSSVQVQVSQFDQIIDEIREGRIANSIDHIRGIYLTSFEQIIDNLTIPLNSIARQLDKPFPFIEKNLGQIFAQGNMQSILNSIFVHILRNSMDHGIESKAIRKSKGKRSQGTITISARVDQSRMILEYSDDGAGLNMETLKKKGIDLDLFGPAETNWKIISETIFKSGVSTKTVSDDISGRGVGMDAVRAILETHNSSIHIEPLNDYDEEEFMPFKFVISLSKDFYIAETIWHSGTTPIQAS